MKQGQKVRLSSSGLLILHQIWYNRPIKEGIAMSTIFLLYEDQALPIRYQPNVRARRIRLTCSLGGDLLLSAPPTTPQQELYRFLDENRQVIGRQVMAARQKAEELPRPEEDTFLWLGNRLAVSVRESARSQARLNGDRVTLSLRKGEWPTEALERLRQRLAVPYLTELTQKRAAELKISGITVAVRPMFSRYGSCQPSTGRICLNSYLTRMDEEVILSVIDHELCHLNHSGHDKAFYDTLLTLCPRYHEHHALLKKELSPYLANIRLQRRARRPHPALMDFSSPII